MIVYNKFVGQAIGFLTPSFLPMCGKLDTDFSKLSNSPWESRRSPLGENIDSCIIVKEGGGGGGRRGYSWD